MFKLSLLRAFHTFPVKFHLRSSNQVLVPPYLWPSRERSLSALFLKGPGRPGWHQNMCAKTGITRSMLTWQSWSITYIQTSNQINQQETRFISSFPFLSCIDQVTYGHMFNHVWTLRPLLRLLRCLTPKHGPASSNSDRNVFNSSRLHQAFLNKKVANPCKSILNCQAKQKS